jgi:hypothetical protein
VSNQFAARTSRGISVETVKDRLLWVIHNARRHRTTIHFQAPAETVAASLSAQLHTDFPSPKGQLVVAGRTLGSDPTDIRLRIFPNGARVGKLRGNTQSDWMKPAVVGTLAPEKGGSGLTYRLDANGIPAFIGLSALAILGILTALVLALGHRFQPSLVALAVAAFLCVGAAMLVSQADQGIREERLLYEWLLGALGPLM